jgi:competence protein ComEC
MFSFKEIPFTKLLLPFVLGIIAGINFISVNWFYLFPIVLICFALFVYSHNKWGKVYRKRIYPGILLFAAFFILGLMITEYHRPQPGIYQNDFIISNSWKATHKYFKAEALIESDNRFFYSGKVMIYLPKNALVKLPDIGDRLITSSDPMSISEPKNPNQFNYAQYLYQKGIVAVVYLREDNFINAGKSNRFGIKRKFNFLRLKLTSIIDNQPMSNETKALLQALLLGDKSNLDPEIKKAYTSAGAMHVLAVSGLHVGIVLLFINFFFKIFEFGKTGKQYRIIKSVITLIIIWTFAGITGFSPSITRATTMFSFLVVGKALNRNANIYNSLSIAAFTLLFIDPYALLSVGFQLSFLAVFGIVFFYPKIYPLLYFKNVLFRKSWELTSVSLAAQTTTFPIALLYFHQFPVYFLISNLVVIPFAFIIVISGLVLIMVSPFETISGFLAYALDHVVMLLNYLVLKVEHLPFYKIGSISIYHTETILIYVFIGFGVAFLLYKNVRFLISSLLILIFLISFSLYKKMENADNKKLVFYSIYNHTAIDLILGNKHIFIADSLLLKQNDKIAFHCQNHWNTLGLSAINSTPKAQLNKPAVYPEMKLILTENHLQMDSTLICINHSSHNIKSLQRFKNKILLINYPFIRRGGKYAYYHSILLNNKYINQKTIKKYGLNFTDQSKSVHNLLSSGYFEFNL